KSLLEYDDVANAQRKEIYALRSELLKAQDISGMIQTHIGDVLDNLIDIYIPPQSVEEQWDVAGLSEALDREFGLKLDIQTWLDSDSSLHEEPLRKKIFEQFMAAYRLKEQQTGADVLRQFEKSLMLQVLDNLWREHLANMDYLRQGIHLRGYAQVDPKQEYKREAFSMFATMVERLKHDVVSILAKVQVRTQEDVAAVEEQRRRARAMQFQHAEVPASTGATATAVGADNTPPPVATVVRDGRKVGRNEPCPCGSGLKYKQCHGKLA
ncbi:MAG TPA: SEC-C metal-binding domain-containing protein, partial [Gammaproteobacteria bacterium]